jgi:hypothetical protein
MKKLLFLLLVFSVILCNGCKKEKITDVKCWGWELNYVKTNNTKLEPEKSGYLLDDAYELKFENDTIFSLNTSINSAGGMYFIAEIGKIAISTFEEFTEVATIDAEAVKLNENLLTVFKEVTAYELSKDGGTLIFKGTKGEVEFKKK